VRCVCMALVEITRSSSRDRRRELRTNDSSSFGPSRAAEFSGLSYSAEVKTGILKSNSLSSGFGK
jgi:hypothetical protein